MHRSLVHRSAHWAAATVWLLFFANTAVRAADTVTNTLAVTRVIHQSTGADLKEAATTAKPGDLLEYAATYRNLGGGLVRQLQPTIPIPAGAVFVPGTAAPASVVASTDGVTFAPLPLKRAVRQADGSWAQQAVANSDVRFVRWTPGDLPAGGTLTVSVRVSIPNDAPASAANAESTNTASASAAPSANAASIKVSP